MIESRYRTTALGEVWTLESFAAGPAAPLVHFAHATGMCAGIYRQLFDRLDGHVNIVASDARGHGRTRLAADPAAMTRWTTYAGDLMALFDVVPRPSRLILAGHSMGATVSMACAAAQPARVAAVVLIEPAFVPFQFAAAWASAAVPQSNPMSVRAARRRGVWPSRETIRAAYRGRGMFAPLPDAVLDAYLDGGVCDRADGQVELACAPAWEAATFAAVSPDLEAAVAGWRGGLTLLHASGGGSTVGGTDAEAIVALCPGSTRQLFAGSDHFLPLHEPAAMAAAILAHA